MRREKALSWPTVDIAQFTPLISHLGFALRLGRFLVAIALLAGPVAPVQAEMILNELRTYAKEKAKYKDLKQLDEIQPAEIRKKKGIIILLHGLASTDMLTFDGFIDAWRNAHIESTFGGSLDAVFDQTLADFEVVGWPHDTLTSIGTNADLLFKRIHMQVGQEGPPIVFVCHSRGGLVARKVAVIMHKRGGKWVDKVKLCVTFGTPHQGADLAAHPYRFMGAYAAVMSQGRNVLSIYRLLSYYAQQKVFEGTDDLRPANAQGKFLRELEQEERDDAPPGRLRSLNILPVGGSYRGGERHLMRLMTHMLGTTNHDLVVRTKSTVPDDVPDGEMTACSHFEYFSLEEIKKDHFKKVIKAIRQALGFEKAEAERYNLEAERYNLIVQKTRRRSGRDHKSIRRSTRGWARMRHDPMRQADIERRLSNLAKARRCGARTRAGHPCRQAAVTGRARCRMHGGARGSGG
jgi:hypothetical protein